MAFDSTRSRAVLFGGDMRNDTWEWDGMTWLARGSGGPRGRRQHAMAYDAQRQFTVMFGGMDLTNTLLGDTWEWDGTTWLKRMPTTSPSPRESAALAYDSAHHQTVLFGGNPLSAQTWVWDGVNWALQSPSSSPSARHDHVMAYDSSRQRTVLFGGLATSGYLADTWEWDGTTWVEVTPANSPTPSSGQTMVYDSALQRVVLSGGQDSSGNFGGTYLWDGSVWTPVSSGVTPPARTTFAAAYDATRGNTILFTGGTVGPGPSGYCGMQCSSAQCDSVSCAYSADWSPVGVSFYPDAMRTDLEKYANVGYAPLGVLFNGASSAFMRATPTSTVWSAPAFQGSVVERDAGTYSLNFYGTRGGGQSPSCPCLLIEVSCSGTSFIGPDVPPPYDGGPPPRPPPDGGVSYLCDPGSTSMSEALTWGSASYDVHLEDGPGGSRLALWSSATSDNAWEVFAQFLAPDGGSTGLPIRVTPGDGNQYRLGAAAFNGSEWGFAYSSQLFDAGTGPRISFVRMSLDGGLIGSPIWVGGTTFQNQTYPVVAWNPLDSEWGLAWEEYGPGELVKFARIDAAGALVPGSAIQVSTTPISPGSAWVWSSTHPLLWDGSGFALFYEEGGWVELAQISGSGSVVSHSQVAAGGGVGAAWSGLEYGVAWANSANQTLFALLSPSGSLVPDSVLLLTDAGWNPDIVWTGTDWAVEWIQSSDGGQSLWTEHVSSTGAGTTPQQLTCYPGYWAFSLSGANGFGETLYIQNAGPPVVGVLTFP
jgi:hypothetical protein